MYFIGHFSIAHLFSRMIDKRTFLSPWMFPLVVIFASLPDTFHVLNMRVVAHNPIGNLFIAIAGVLIIRFFIKVNWSQCVVLFIASFSHFLGDLIFGSYYLLFPWSFRDFYLVEFNSIPHMVAEISLTIIFLLIFIKSGELSRFRDWVFSVFRRKEWDGKKVFRSRTIPILLVISMVFLATLQFLIFFV